MVPAPSSGARRGFAQRRSLRRLVSRGRVGTRSTCSRSITSCVLGHVILYRHNDSRFPFLWEDSRQPAGRWHNDGEGPAQYFSDTPGGAWAEFLRHEEIVEVADLEGVSRALWAVEVGEPTSAAPALPDLVCRGGLGSYPTCQSEARRLRDAGVTVLQAKSAALKNGLAAGWRVELGFREGPPADGRVFVLFGPRPELIGWLIVDRGRPPTELLDAVHHFDAPDHR